jgi:acyl carrier protein
MAGSYPLLSQPTSRQIYDRLCILASERLTLPPGALAQLHPGASLVEGLQLDSLAQVTFLAALEEEFSIMLEPADREDIVTVHDLVAVIEARVIESARATAQKA